MSTTNKDKKKVKITIARDYYLTDNSRRFTQYPLVGDYYLTDYLDDISGKIFEGNTKKEASNKAGRYITSKIPYVVRIITGKEVTFVGKFRDNKTTTGVKISPSNGRYSNSKIGYYSIKYIKDGEEVMEDFPPFFLLVTTCNRILSSDYFINEPYHADLSPEASFENEDEDEASSTFNLFPGFKAIYQEELSFEQATLKCKPIIDHIYNILGNGNKEYGDYILEWIMRPIRLLKRNLTMLTLKGPQGVGKDIIFDFLYQYVLGMLISFKTTGLKKITQKHNTILGGKMFSFISEAENKTNNKCLNDEDSETLKSLITDITTIIEPKGVDSFQTNNHCNFVLTTNSNHPFQVQEGDRRHAMFETSKVVKGVEYFDDLLENIMNQEMGDAFYTMARLSKPLCNIKNLPDTEFRRDNLSNSKARGTIFFDDIVDNNIYIPRSKLKIKEGHIYIGVSEFYLIYKRWYNDTKNGLEWSSKLFTMHVKNIPGFSDAGKITVEKERLVYIEILPELHNDVYYCIEGDDEGYPIAKLLEVKSFKNISIKIVPEN